MEPAAGLRVDIRRLPGTAAKLFGRDDELRWLDDAWRDRVHLVSIVAMGGVGKSALVNAWLASMRDRGWPEAERVYGWSFFSQGTDRLTSSDEFIDAALRWFGDADPTRGSPWDKGERLASLVAKTRSILGLDGVEPLQWGAGTELAGRFKDPALEVLVEQLGAQNNGLCLVTSRVPIANLERLVGEKVQQHDLNQLPDEAGAELLRARGVNGEDDELRAAVGEYKGHALALTLLASYLEDVGESDIRRRREIGPLEEAERLGGHAKRVMAAYERSLGKAEVAILRLLGLFNRPAERDRIEALRAGPAVAGLTDALTGMSEREWNKTVARLRRTRLLETGEDKRIDAHPLVRQHFGEQLRKGQPEAWMEGHRRLYEHLKSTAKELPESLGEMAPLYAAVVHGCKAEKYEEALVEVYKNRIQRRSDFFNRAKLGAIGSEVAVLSAFFDPPWENLAPGLSESDQAWVVGEGGVALRALGRLGEAEALTRLTLKRFLLLEDWNNAATAASTLTEILLARGDIDKAVDQAAASLGLADKSGYAYRRLIDRTTLAAALHAQGYRERSEKLFEEAEAMQKEWQPALPRLYSVRGFHYCDLLLDRTRHAEVLERAAQALQVVETHHWLLPIALDHLSLGRAHFLAAQGGEAGELERAAGHLSQAVDGLRSAGRQDFLPLGLLARAALHLHTRAFDKVRRDLNEALSLSVRSGFRLHEADAHLGFARLTLAQGDPAKAREHLEKAQGIVTATGYHRRDGEVEEIQKLIEAAPRPEPEPPAPPVVSQSVVATREPNPNPPITLMPTPLRIFVSYSHKDDAFREELETHLKLLQRQGHIATWTDRRISPGATWAAAIDENIEQADIILLLVSADFVASDYCFGKELTVAMQRHNQGKARVVPIILRPVDLEAAR